MSSPAPPDRMRMTSADTGSELWQQFLVKLRMAGTTIEDIQECSQGVLHTLLAELGFTALQTARLETEWTRRRPPSLAPARIPLAETSAEFKEVSAAALTFFGPVRTQGCVVSVLGVERVTNPMLEAAFRTRRQDLHNPNALPLRKWVHVPIEAVDRVVAEGFSVVDGSTMTATPFGRGYVVTSEADPRVPANIQNNKLVLVDACVGNSKLLLETEEELHRGRTMSEMLRLLYEEGYDSVQGRRRASANDVFVVYHPQQIVPKYVVTYSVNTQNVLPGGGGSGMGALHNIRCRDHPTHCVEFWCEDEARLVCSHCIFVGPYRSKRCLVVSEAAALERDIVKRWQINAQEFVVEIGRVLLSFDAVLDTVEREHREQVVTVQKKIDAIKMGLDGLLGQLVSDATSLARSQSSTHQRLLSKLVTLVNTVEERIALSQKLLKSDDDIGLLELRQAIETPLEVLTIPPAELPMVSVDEEQIIAVLRGCFSIASVPSGIVLPHVIDANQILPEIRQPLARSTAEPFLQTSSQTSSAYAPPYSIHLSPRS